MNSQSREPWVRTSIFSFLMLFLPVTLAFAQDQPDADPTLRDFDPRPELVVPQTTLPHARFPAIDIHTHFSFKLRGDKTALDKYLDIMDRNHIALSVSFDAPLGNEEEHLAFIQPYRDRIPFFVHIDFLQTQDRANPAKYAVNQPGFARLSVEQLRRAKDKGAVGVKLFKQFGLTIQKQDGSLVKIDDPVFDPIWKECGRLGMPVIMHTADPIAFFKPIDKQNERWEELSRHPDWSFHGDAFPSREALLAARNRVIARHPETTFIGAHVANNGEDLAQVAKWLDQYPNLVVEIASRINELGRQPFTARKFIVKYQDRVLFGTDGPWPEQRVKYYWRFLETHDEYFRYSEKTPPPQGMWRIYGIKLPDEVLQKVYFKNALRILPAIEKRYQRQVESANW